MYGRGDAACRRISVGESSKEWLIVALVVRVRSGWGDFEGG